ncbi:Unconventional myosin-XIX [Balamuthia mandrillaris]
MKSNEAMEESVFTVGTQVWVDHPSEGFQAGVIISTEEIAGGVKIKAGTEYTVLGDDDKQERKCRAEELQLRNPSILEGCDDMTALSYMNEPSILHNLHMRFSIHQIYTYTGPILIAINPYQRLPIYGKQMIAQYCGQPLGKLAPHVYAIADNAFRSMRDDNMSQSILVSGESGAGKTETTKVLLQFFAAMGQNKGEGNVHKQVLESTPLLEAFGNAKTLRNNNSSRFGKFIQIEFDKAGNMCGAAVQTYLLEKSRIVRQQPGERNYHVFYQLIAGLPPDKKRELHLTSAEDYSYTNHSGCIQVEDIDDKDRFQDTIKALETVGISKAQQNAIFTILAAVLHIGNVRFENAGGSDAGLKLVDENPLRLACELLGCDLEGMRHVLTERKVSAANETYTVPMSLEQADGARDALSMLLYSRMFDWLVTALNDNIANTSKQQRQKAKAEKGGLIGVLDIYGFECFDNNSFEQFCINYANEKLQQQFNAHIFKLEQQEYVREELKWTYIDFDDNQPCLDLIEQKPLGILSLLDEECRLAKATPETFVDKLTKNHKQCKYFSLPRFSRSSFTVEHYAGKVTYDTAAFMDKNKDYIIEAQVALMEQSNNDFVKDIFLAARKAALELEKQELAKKGPTSVSSPARRSASAAVKFVSVASQFKESLAALMGSISSTNPHYIRCIKPNPDKRAMDFDKLLVLHQLRCGGVLSSIKISVAGYPNRRTYEEFRLRYQMLGKFIPAAEREHRQVCHGLIKEMYLEEGKYQFGKTKLYLRAGQIGLLEKRRTEKLNKVAVIVQKNWRRYLVQKEYVRLRRALLRIQAYLKMGIAKNLLQSLRRERASVVIQRNGRCWLARQAFLSDRISSVVLQKVTRMWQARWSYKRELAVIQLQSCWRGVIARRTAERLRREGAALLIQKRMRSFHYRQYWKKLCRAVVIGQSMWRGKQSRKLYSEMREEARNLNNIVAAKMKEVEGLEYRLQAEVKQKIRLLKEKERMAEALERMQEEMNRKEEIQLAAAKKEAQMEALRRELQELKEKQEQKDQERKLKEQHALELLARQKREEEERLKHEKAMETQRVLELASQLHQEELRRLGEENKEWQTKYRLLLAQKEEAEASLHAEVEQWRAKYDQLNAELQRELAEAQQERMKWSSEAMETLATRRMKLAPPLNAEASDEHDLANQPPPFVELPSHNVDIDLADRIRSNIAAFDKSYQATKHVPAIAVTTAAAQSAPSSPYIMVSREPGVSPRSPYAATVVQARDTTTVPKFVLSNNAEQKQPANQSLLSLLPKASDEASLRLLHFVIFELEPGFCEGVPVPALALYSFLLHWGSFPVFSNEGNLLTFIANSLRKVIAGSLSDNTLLTYWLSNTATLLHLVHKKNNHRGGADASAHHEEEETFAVYDMESVDDEMELFQVSSVSSEANSPMLSSSGYGHVDSNNSESPKSLRIRAKADSFQEGHMLLDNRLAKELSKLDIPEREKRHSSATFFHEQLKDLVAKIYAVLMKRLCVRLELLVKDAVLTPVVTDHGKSQGGATVSRAGTSSNTNNRRVNIESVRMVLQDYLVGFIENFVHPGLVQRFYRQAFRFINAHIFNELLLNRRVCSMENGVHIKMQVASLEQWLHERGGVWCLGAEEELEPTRQVLRVLFVDKHSLIASREQRQEVCPTLNTMQLKQLLMSYTPGYLEPPINLRLLSKLGLREEETERLKEGEEGENHGHQEFLLLESSPTGWPLRFSELHFLELADALQVAFPTELKTHIHSLNAETTLAKMERANQQLRAAQDLNNKARHHHSSSSSSSPSSSTDASPTPRPRKALFGSLFHSGVKKK